MDNNNIKILAVDDNFDNLIIIQALVSESFPNATIFNALNGKEALKQAEKEIPDVILLDVVMPEMDGFEVCKRLKSDPNLSDIPVVFVTALKDDKESRIKALEVGAEAFLAKPIDQSELVAEIRAMMKIRTAYLDKQQEKSSLLTLVQVQTKELKTTHTATLNLLEDLRTENEARRATEEALKASEALYRSILDASPDNITVSEIDGRIKMISPNGLKLIGYKEEEIIGRYLGEFLAPEDVERAIRNVENMFKGVFNGPEEYKLIHADKSVIPVEINAEFVRNDAGEPMQIVFAIRDITERIRNQKAIIESELKYRLITEKISDVVWIMDLKGKSMFVSQSIENFTGFTVEEYLKQSISERFTPESAALALSIFDDEFKIYKNTNVRRDDFKKIIVLNYRCKDGRIKTGELLITLYYDDSHTLIGIHGVTRDITERIEAEKALIVSEEKFRFMAENTSDIIWHMDMDFRFDYVSTAIERIQGYKPEELIGKELFEILSEDGIRQIKEVSSGISENLKKGGLPKELQFEYESICKDGSWIWVEVNVSLHFDNEMKPTGFYGVTRDVSERKKDEIALRESEEKYRLLVENSPNGIAIYQDGKFVYVNATGLKIFGANNADQLLGKPVLSIVHPDSLNAVIKRVSQVTSGSQVPPMEEKLLRFDNSVFYAEVTALATTFNGRLAGQVIVNDITDRKLADEKLGESEEKFRDMANLLPQVVFEIDLEGTITYVNQQAQSLFGYEIDELIGTNSLLVHVPEERNRVKNGMIDKLKGIAIDDKEFRMVRKDGSVFPALIFINPIIKDKNPIGLRGVVIDITEQKNAEKSITHIARLYALQSQINQAIVTSKNEQILFETICNVAVQYGKFKMSWIGVYDIEQNKIIPGYHAGFNDGYVETLNIVPGDEKTGRGPTGLAFYENKMVFCNDIATDELMIHWKDEALKRGYKSSFSTPITRKRKPYATFTLYASEKDFFYEDEQKLLFDIGENISFALEAFDSENERRLAEVALIESESKYRSLMDNSPEGITIYVDGKVAYINKEALRLMRTSDKSDLMGKTIVDFIHPDNVELVIERMKLVAMAPINSILPSVEEKYIRLDGTEVFVEIKVMPILFEGKPAIQLAGHDITDRKQAEFALEQSRIELQTIYDNAPVMICVVDEERQIQFANNAFTSLTGVHEDIMKRRAVGIVIGCINSMDDSRGCGYGPKCKSCTLRLAIQQTFLTGVGQTNIEYQSTLEIGGVHRNVSLLGSTALINNDDSKRLLMCLIDITDRKLTEEALQKSETLLRTFIDNSPFEIWARDINSIGILENKKLTDHYGSIIGHSTLDDPRVDNEIIELWERNNARVFADEILDEEYEFMVNGEPRQFQQIVFPIKNNDKIIGIAGFNIDITERKLAEEKIRENNIRLELAMQISNMAWWEMDYDTGGVRFGEHKASMLGYAPEKFTHYSDFMDMVHPDDYENAMNSMRNHLSGMVEKYEIEYRLLTSNGDYKWFYDIGSVSKRDTNGNPMTISGLVIDISYRKEAEKELADQKQFFEQMFMQSSLSTQILDNEGWCERINPKLSQIFGVEAKFMEGKVYNIFNDAEIIKNGIDLTLKKVFEEAKTTEWEVYFDIGDAADSQNIELIKRKKAWFTNWAYPILDEFNKVSHVIIQHSDITDRKMAENALIESKAQLANFAAHLQSVREEERSILARDIHDDLGQILIAMKIDLGLLKQNVMKTIQPDEFEILRIKFEELNKLVDSTLKSARRIMTDLRPEVLDLLGYVDTVTQHLKSFEERTKILCVFTNNVENLELNSQQSVALYRIVQEALNNTAKYSRATEVRVILNQHNNYLTLEISDNGVGFDMKDPKKRDSYGLMGMKERVILLEGKLEISSAPGTGTQIKVTMPYLNT